MSLEINEEEKRFILELEFVQCLANPQYLQHLAQNGFFEQQDFINYLKYLCYWQTREYSKYIIFPYCLEILDYLQEESFRLALKSADVALLLHEKQYKHWVHNRKK